MQSSLLQLKLTLEQAQTNTLNMREKISAFENRLAKLDEKMRPVQNATAPLSRARRNIDLSLAIIEKMTEYFRIAPEVEPIVITGFREDSNIPEFLESIDRLILANEFFKGHTDIKSSEKALGKVRSVLKV